MAPRLTAGQLQVDCERLEALRISLWTHYHWLDAYRAKMLHTRDQWAIEEATRHLRSCRVQIADVNEALRRTQIARDAAILDPDAPLLDDRP